MGIKIYISKEGEPEAVQAAGDGKNGQVEVKYLPRALRLTVHGPQLDNVFLLDRLYYEIIPEESTFRVSLNKRITLTLKKKESFTWLKLLKPELKYFSMVLAVLAPRFLSTVVAVF